MRKVVFLDRDGTINIDKAYVYKIKDFEFINGVIDSMKKFADMGFEIVIITNQSGIARGFYTEQDLEKLNNWLIKTLDEKGIKILDILYCPHHPKGKIEPYNIDCDCRKPNVKLFINAVKKHDIDLDNSYAIGDKMRDLEICKKSNCKGFLIGNNEKSTVVEQVKENKNSNIFYFENMLGVAEKIEEYQREKAL